MISNLLKQNKIRIVLAVFLLSLGLLFLKDWNPTTFDANLGIEFVGGIRVPISLEKSVDADTMSLMVDAIKSRVNKFGLGQAVVRPLGDKEIVVEIPKADAKAIESIEHILREQGRFEAIVDGKQVLNGNDIITSAVGGPSGESVQQGTSAVTWNLVFSITGSGELKFATLAGGKTGLPVYMFLDRPENASVIVNASVNYVDASLSNALKKEGDDLIVFDEKTLLDKQKQEFLNLNKSVVVLDEALKTRNPALISFLKEKGYSETGESGKKLLFKPSLEMIPDYVGGSFSSWKAIGLKSSPILRVDPIKQNAITQYSISGTSSGATPQEQYANGLKEIKELKTVLSGGKLPVTTIVGSYYEVAPSLGRQFLVYSILGVIIAIFVVGILLGLRYRSFKLVLPIIFTNIVEVTILMALIGTFGTLELSAMAGVIALIGTGVDNQILITDELLKTGHVEEEEVSNREKFKRAFYIVFATAAIAIISMLPLFLSGIVEVMGFALATILGVLIGVGVTRPAYGALVEELYGFKK